MVYLYRITGEEEKGQEEGHALRRCRGQRGRHEDGEEDRAWRLGVPHRRHPLLLAARNDHRNPREDVGHPEDRGWSQRHQGAPELDRRRWQVRSLLKRCTFMCQRILRFEIAG